MLNDRKIIYLDVDGKEATWIGTAKGLLDDTPNARILTIKDIE